MWFLVQGYAVEINSLIVLKRFQLSAHAYDRIKDREHFQDVELHQSKT